MNSPAIPDENGFLQRGNPVRRYLDRLINMAIIGADFMNLVLPPEGA
jgi:hypothetical protein